MLGCRSQVGSSDCENILPPTPPPLSATFILFAIWFFCFFNHEVESIFNTLKLAWAYDLLWPRACGRNVHGPVLRLSFKLCLHLPFSPSPVSPSLFSFLYPCQENILRWACWMRHTGQIPQSLYGKECPSEMRKPAADHGHQNKVCWIELGSLAAPRQLVYTRPEVNTCYNSCWWGFLVPCYAALLQN